MPVEQPLVAFWVNKGPLCAVPLQCHGAFRGDLTGQRVGIERSVHPVLAVLIQLKQMLLHKRKQPIASAKRPDELFGGLTKFERWEKTLATLPQVSTIAYSCFDLLGYLRFMLSYMHTAAGMRNGNELPYNAVSGFRTVVKPAVFKCHLAAIPLTVLNEAQGQTVQEIGRPKTKSKRTLIQGFTVRHHQAKFRDVHAIMNRARIIVGKQGGF
ncbi:MAG: hypothetical protein NTZ05_05790 [Chloroflexi bacterium]|nr:hypothetical protein [Chloroflexota bacterium]